MLKNRLFIYSVLFFVCYHYSFSQKVNNDKDALALCLKAKENMLNIETKKSIIQCQEVLDYAIKNKRNFLASKAYNLIGLNFEEFADTKRAISYYEKAMELALIVKNDTLIASIYNNLGGIYIYNNINESKGLEYYKKSLFHAERAKLKEDFILTKMNVATSLINLKRYDEGFATLKKLEKGVIASKDPETNLYLSILKATYFNEYKNDFEKANFYYNQALTFTSKIELGVIKLNISNLYEEMSKFYLKYDDVKNAYKFLKLHDDLESEIFDSNKVELLKEQELSIKLSEVNNHILEVEVENKANIKKLKNNSLFIWTLIGLLGLFLYMLYTVFRNNKKNKQISKKLKIANLDLYEAKKKSEEASRLKSQFISTVSHELRTPLYGVIGMTEIIENEFKELKENNYFKTLKFSSKHLLNLINDVLYMYKIQEGNIDLVSEKINLKEEIEVIKNLLDVVALQNKNKIEIQIATDIPAYIQTDKTRLAQLIINLLSNAIKFTKNGIVIIKIDQYFDEKPTLQFQIIDNGIGIPKEHLNNVFNKFVQLDRTVDENLQGTGLGLAIVKKIVTLFGGKIKIESEENKGTNVSFTIPLFEAEKSLKSDQNDKSTLTKQISILVVDDNKINQMVSRKMLLNNNQKCTMAYSGFEAIEFLEKENFDLILMDIHMPVMNGFETSKKIRDLNIKTPIIALTASDRDEILENPNMIYLNDILVKPFEFRELEFLINVYL
jgi:signal transduction histidine kinase/CheY-like chemotaxis protein